MDRKDFPAGRNVGTQLRALRAKKARDERARQAAEAAAVTQARRNQFGQQLTLPNAEGWFAAKGWQPFEFQREVWQHVEKGRSGLLHATTGSGKTYAVGFGLLNGALSGEIKGGGLRLLWLTPMRALAADIARALTAPLEDFGLEWTVGVRTGDTDSAERARQAKKLPEVLITTPESLSLMLSHADAREQLSDLALVVVDEWHELIGTKRGVQVQLALARLKRWSKTRLAVWGLSATLGNTEHAMQVLLNRDDGALVRGRIDKTLIVDTLLPQDPGRFPWGGHLGIKMVPAVVAEIASSSTTLVFTNTRSQAELWYQAILEAKPEWAGQIALHHGSLAGEVRSWVEAGLKEGRMKAVVATSSLDLGVDFLPVERVLQVGSPKGVARLMQRAGRSGHAPGRASRVSIVPTHTLELVEAAAARTAIHEGRIEARRAPERPIDVLVQHLVTIALGGGFIADELLAEMRDTWSYRMLSDEDWRWALDFVGGGGEALRAYPDYRRVVRGEDDVYRVTNAGIGHRHRMSIGTIVSDASVLLKMLNGREVGVIEEAFISRLRRGDTFLFGGRMLELQRVHEMTAYVRVAKHRGGAVPRWQGSKMPLSSEMADAALRELELALAGRYEVPEMRLARPLIELQAKWSKVPTRDDLVVESMRSREGRHLFVYPFAGRHAHIGLGSLLAYRIGRVTPATFSIAMNDYGFELLSPVDIDWMGAWQQRSDGLLDTDNLLEDVLASLNAGELARRRFREVARISGLIFQGYPGAPKSARQLQASSGLFYDVFRRYDSGNKLLSQAEREVLEQELDIERLRAALSRMRAQRIHYRLLSRPTPFAFPLMVERLREQLTTEKLGTRIERMLADLERAAA